MHWRLVTYGCGLFAGHPQQHAVQSVPESAADEPDHLSWRSQLQTSPAAAQHYPVVTWEGEAILSLCTLLGTFCDTHAHTLECVTGLATEQSSYWAGACSTCQESSFVLTIHHNT